MHLFSYLSILAKPRLNEMSLKPAHTVAELASARQHQQARPTIMERAVEGKAKGGGLVQRPSGLSFLYGGGTGGGNGRG